jgi:hypothetical protein
MTPVMYTDPNGTSVTLLACFGLSLLITFIVSVTEHPEHGTVFNNYAEGDAELGNFTSCDETGCENSTGVLLVTNFAIHEAPINDNWTLRFFGGSLGGELGYSNTKRQPYGSLSARYKLFEVEYEGELNLGIIDVNIVASFDLGLGVQRSTTSRGQSWNIFGFSFDIT